MIDLGRFASRSENHALRISPQLSFSVSKYMFENADLAEILGREIKKLPILVDPFS